MSRPISYNNKSLDECILRELKLFSNAQTYVYTVATEWIYVRDICLLSMYCVVICLSRQFCWFPHPLGYCI